MTAPNEMTASGNLQRDLAALEMGGPERIGKLVDRVLAEAVARGASDVHFEPTHRAMEIRFRLDGVLVAVGSLKRELAPNIAARLKVLADLLTYRVDIPQEGRLTGNISTNAGSGPGSGAAGGDSKSFGTAGVEMRVSTFPTIHGEKVAVRMFDATGQTLDLDQLGLSQTVLAGLKEMLRQRSGMLLLTGPSGSGKTTTIYAALRHLVHSDGGTRHVVTIEDPVEQVIEGVSQAHARPGTEFDFARGLRSLLRQDPEVFMIGEIRDPETAGISIEAALTGHLVISTLHAGSACGVISRLLEMGIESYLLTSGLRSIINQRLVRRLCPQCRQPLPAPPNDANESAGWQAVGCNACAQTGYHGRLLLAEMLTIDTPLRQAILNRPDVASLEHIARQSQPATIWNAAADAVREGLTSQQEVDRILGPRSSHDV